MTFQYYGLDERARKLIKNQITRGQKNSLDSSEMQILIKESHKMRQAIIYGLERFWGEHLRLQDKNKLDSAKSEFWGDAWNELVDILELADVKLPNYKDINKMADQLWNLSIDDQQIALAVLTQLCDAMVWWTQRYKNTIGN